MKAVGIAAVLLLASAGAAEAESWRLAAIATNELRGVDTDSIRSIGSRRDHWVIVVKDVPSRPGESYILVHEEADCERRTTKTLGIIVYDVDGNVLDSGEGERVSDVVPGSFGESQFNAVCTETWLDEPPGLTAQQFRDVVRGVFDSQ